MFGFFHGKFQKFSNMCLSGQVSESLGRVIVQMFATDVSNHLINFLMCTDCKKGQKPRKRSKTKDQSTFTLSLAEVSPGDRKQDVNKCWPNTVVRKFFEGKFSLIKKIKVKYFCGYMTFSKYFYLEYISLVIIHAC